MSDDRYKLGEISLHDTNQLRSKAALPGQRCELLIFTESNQPVIIQATTWTDIAEVLDYVRTGQA